MCFFHSNFTSSQRIRSLPTLLSTNLSNYYSLRSIPLRLSDPILRLSLTGFCIFRRSKALRSFFLKSEVFFMIVDSFADTDFILSFFIFSTYFGFNTQLKMILHHLNIFFYYVQFGLSIEGDLFGQGHFLLPLYIYAL